MSKIPIYLLEGLSGCPVVKTEFLVQGAWVRPLVVVLRSLMPRPKKKKFKYLLENTDNIHVQMKNLGIKMGT